MELLDQMYETVCRLKSNINEHCPTLFKLAKQCQHITELGTNLGRSTTAFLAARPKKLTCYDIRRRKEVDALVAANVITNETGKKVTEFVFIKADTTQVEIEPTELLFIDTIHSYAQVKKELELHASKVESYIVFHDTVAFGILGQRGDKGIMFAIEEFLETNEEWKMHKEYKNNNGLIVIKKKRF